MAPVEESPIAGVEPSLTTPLPEPEAETDLRRNAVVHVRDGRSEQRRAALARGVTAAGSTTGALLGLGAVVLTILALAGLLTLPLAAVAVIVASAALLSESASLAARTRVQPSAARAVSLGGAGVDTFTGVAGIVLGVLSLVGIQSRIFLSIAVLTLGAGLLFSGATTIMEEIHSLMTRAGKNGGDAVGTVGGVHLTVGAGALILGILGILGGSPLLLTLIATLSIGAALMLSGASLGVRTVTTTPAT